MRHNMIVYVLCAWSAVMSTAAFWDANTTKHEVRAVAEEVETVKRWINQQSTGARIEYRFDRLSDICERKR